jgi:toxin ParE1/3/4
MRTLRRHPRVRDDLAEAFGWYENRKPGLGAAFSAEVQLFLRELKRDPLRNAVRFDDIRRLNLKRFPYSLFYFVEGDIVGVVAVLYARSDADAAIRQRRSEFP